MDTCPFCNTQVQVDLLRFGGSCPACFNEIPGEEAPTNPGVQAASGEKETERKGSGLLLAAVGLIAVLGGVGFWAWSQKHQAEELAAVQPVDDFFIVPAEELDSELAEADRLANEEAQAAADEAALLQAESTARTSQPKTTISTPSRLTAEPRSTTTAEGSPRQVTLMPQTTPNPLSDPLMVAPTLIGATVVLRDPQEIYEMIRTAMERYVPRMKHCYDKQLKLESGLKGKWWLSFKVGTSGKPLGVSVWGDGVRHAELEACLLKTAKEMTFQRISQAQDIKFPLNFTR